MITISETGLRCMIAVLIFAVVIWLIALWAGRYDNAPLFDEDDELQPPADDRRDPIEDQHGRWLMRIHDDQPISEGHKFAADSRVEVLHDGVVVREFLYPSYRIWTLLAHWKDDLDPDAEAPEPLVETVDCTYCDVEINPEIEDGETAFDCLCCMNGWHHYDCAHNCMAYLDDRAADQAIDAAKDARVGG